MNKPDIGGLGAALTIFGRETAQFRNPVKNLEELLRRTCKLSANG
jgi:hypothetical protein